MKSTIHTRGFGRRVTVLVGLLLWVCGCQCLGTGVPAATCHTDADCDDGLFCNGIERCVDDMCEEGQAPCVWVDDICGPACIEELDACVDLCGGMSMCHTDADCDDGLFCTGIERCVAGECEEGYPPCPGLDDVCGPECREELDACVSFCTDDAQCDDGVFCNGAETCYYCRCAPGCPPCDDCDEESGCL